VSTPDPVLGDVVEMLVEVVGEDFLLDVEISRETTFTDDLALESIEFVALAEKLQERYGGRVDFAAFVADMDITEIMAMKVGTLVAYIEERTTAVRSGS
jgi:acyl carrier protein